MSKHAKSEKSTTKSARKDWPLVVYVWIVGLGLTGYLVVGEIVLGAQPHPWHWAAGLAGTILGYIVGWLWYQWRGDIY